MFNRAKWPVVAALVALLMTTGVVYGQTFRQTNFDWIVVKRILNTGTSTLRGAVTMSGAATVGTDLTVADDATITGDATIGAFLGLTPQTAITVGYQGTITPTGGLQYITATAARGTRMIITTTVAAGTIAAFYNSGAQTITLTDTAPLCLGGNAALGAGDTLVVFNNGTCWVQLSKTDN